MVTSQNVCLHLSELVVSRYIEQQSFSSSQLAVLRSESASVKTLQGTVDALEQDKANLKERVQRLEKDLAAGPNSINSQSGRAAVTTAHICGSAKVSSVTFSQKDYTHDAPAFQVMQCWTS